ncbi:hypothetical protein PR048_017311 [Dryococelus australis]|uniref:DUF4371 domain-containing protein n=1 Tax=Dryococelus australis TaxID=614101 RepID=A0ABQ9H9D3_9NEOP|nr:hypothetical protein PR048_017311 [Dryococelus australis]
MRKSLFTLLIDESTDVSVTRKVLIMARIFTTQVETHLYKVVAFSGKATGENLFNIVNSSFDEDNIPWQNCISMSSDGAKSMVGEFNSLLSCIRGKQENVWFLHCTCHVAHLTASNTCSELPDVCEQLPQDYLGKGNMGFKTFNTYLRSQNTKYYAHVSPGGLQCCSVLIAFLSSGQSLHSILMQKLNQKKQEHPYVHKLYSEMSVFACRFTANFVQSSAIQQAYDEETEFFTNVCKFYEIRTKELYRFLPLKNDVLKNIDIADPAKKQSEELVKVQNLTKAFQKVIANNEYDELNSEFVAYTLWDPPAEMSTAMTHETDTY